MTAVPVAAFAQNKTQVVPPPKAEKKLPEAPSKLPKVGADRTRGDFVRRHGKVRRHRRRVSRPRYRARDDDLAVHPWTLSREAVATVSTTAGSAA